MKHHIEEVKNFLLEIVELQEILKSRAVDLLYATTPHLNYPVRVTGIEYEKDYVSINFVEDTNSDCPNEAFTELTIEHLSMFDSDWKAHVAEVTRRVRAKKQTEIDAEYERQRNKKMEQYLALKSELGIE